jgi:hypothetical protein
MMLEIYMLYTILAFFATFFAIYKNSPIFFFFAMLFCAILIPTSFDVSKVFCNYNSVSDTFVCYNYREQYIAFSYLFLGLLLLNMAMGVLSFIRQFKV